MRPQRRSDWEERLASLISSNLRRAHSYGHWDCLLWPAAAVKAVVGRDFGRGHRGKYRSLAGAYRHLKSLGFDSPEALLDIIFECKPVGFAGRGDLVLIEVPDIAGPAIAAQQLPAVCIGGEALALIEDGAGNSGLARFPRSTWLKAWAVADHHSGKLRRLTTKRKLGKG